MKVTVGAKFWCKAASFKHMVILNTYVDLFTFWSEHSISGQVNLYRYYISGLWLHLSINPFKNKKKCVFLRKLFFISQITIMTVKEKLEWPHGSCFYLTKKLVVFFCLLCGIIKCFQSPLTFNVARWLLQKVAADCTLHSGVHFFFEIVLKDGILLPKLFWPTVRKKMF